MIQICAYFTKFPDDSIMETVRRYAKMTIIDFFKIICEDIHSTVVATNDKNNLPVTCVIDIMDCDCDGLYFLTARGKSFYDRLKKNGYLSLTGIKGSDTMHSISASVFGYVREIGKERLQKLLQKNPYMYEIYPSKESQEALTVFQIYKGNGEIFDLSQKPIKRYRFTFGNADEVKNGYYITNKCTNCGECLSVCPQNCIDTSDGRAKITQMNCLHCGNCFDVCRFGAVEKEG